MVTGSLSVLVSPFKNLEGPLYLLMERSINWPLSLTIIFVAIFMTIIFVAIFVTIIFLGTLIQIFAGPW